MSGALAVRRLTPDDDAEALGRLVVAAYRSLPGYLVEPEYEILLADVAGRAAMAEVAVAVHDDRLVGCVTYVPGPDNPLAEFDDPDAAGLRMLAVDPEARRTGAGTALVQWCVREARGAGRRRIVLHSAHYMTAAHRLYERLGFARDPARDWEPFEGLRLLAYRLDC